MKPYQHAIVRAVIHQGKQAISLEDYIWPESCICPETCDCEAPNRNSALISNNCPFHNERPEPVADCGWKGTHRNQFVGIDVPAVCPQCCSTLISSGLAVVGAYCQACYSTRRFSA